MNEPPFLISSDAIVWMVEKIQLGKMNPTCAGLHPVLYFGFAYDLKDKEGNLEEVYPGHFFDLGWYRPESISDNGGLEIEISGYKLFVWPDTIERLMHKRLILETQEVGYPVPADKKRQFLKAVARE